MTFTETAAAMRRLADGIDKIVKQQGHDAETGKPKPMLDGEAGVGGAALLCYLRDCVTTAGRDSWDRPTLLVLLETISRDAEIFPCGVGATMWAAEDEDAEV